MNDTDLSQICDKIDEIYRTRLEGVVWFQVFERGSGNPIAKLGNVRPRMNIGRVTTIGTQLLALTDRILQAIGVIGTGVEELVIVGNVQRLYLFPMNNLVMAVLASEKIGDVCFHSAWVVLNKDLSVRPHLEPLTNQEYAYQPKEIYNIFRSYQVNELYKHLLDIVTPVFDGVKLIWIANDASQDVSVGSLVGHDVPISELASTTGLIRQLAGELENILEEEETPIGTVTEIIIGREGLRENPKPPREPAGSLVIGGGTRKEDSYLVVVTSESLGKALFGMRQLLGLPDVKISSEGIGAVRALDYRKVDQACITAQG